MSDSHDGNFLKATDRNHIDPVEATIQQLRSPEDIHPWDLSWLFIGWAWYAGHRDWNRSLRALATTLRGLERCDLIERRRVRRPNAPTHHGFVLTERGRDAVKALSGNWIEEVGE